LTSNVVYVHAGFTNVNGVDYEYFPGLFYWDRTLWETALALDKTMATDNISTPNVLLYIKKFTWVTTCYPNRREYARSKANVWNVDTGAALKGH
jgi:serine/threonine protein phosphatase 1